MKSDSHLLCVGEFVLNTDSRKLYDNNREVLLSPTLYALLKFFIDNQNQVLTKEMIIGHVWKGKTVVDANVNQNIKKLRDTLGDSATTPAYIETVTGEGFRFIANSDIYQAKPQTITSKQSFKLTIGLLIITAAIAIWSLFFNSAKEKTNTLKEFLPLTTLKGIEHYPSVSPDNQFLLFNHKGSKSDWNVFIKPMNKESYHLILDSKYDELFPVVSPSGKKLMYFLKGDIAGERKCGLYYRDLQLSEMTVGTEKLIKKCHQHSERLRGEWYSDSEIFLSINEETTSPASIYSYNLDDAKQKLISRPDSKGFGDYVFKYSPELNKLAYIRNIGWASSEIWVYDLSAETHQKIKSTPIILRGLDWNEHWLYFQSGSRAISRIAEDGTEELVASSIGNIYLPFSIAEKKIGVVQGEMRIVDINRIYLENKKKEVVVSSSFNDYYGVNSGNEIVFISTRRGEPQVWLKKADGDVVQLTFFDQAYELKWLSTYQEKQLVMFNKSGEIVIIDNQGTPIFSSLDYSNQVHNNPVFDQKKNRILYSKQYNGEWTIESRKLNDLGKHQMLVKGITAKACLESDCIYYFKDSDPFIYQYDEANNSSRKLIEVGEIRKADQWALMDDENLLFLEEGEINQLVQINLASGKKTPLLATNVRDFSYDKFANAILANVRTQGNTGISYFQVD